MLIKQIKYRIHNNINKSSSIMYQLLNFNEIVSLNTLFYGTIFIFLATIIFITDAVVFFGRDYGIITSPIIAIQIDEPNRVADMLIEDCGMAVVPAKINEPITEAYYTFTNSAIIC